LKRGAQWGGSPDRTPFPLRVDQIFRAEVEPQHAILANRDVIRVNRATGAEPGDASKDRNPARPQHRARQEGVIVCDNHIEFTN
jgi:hypothetical protein